MTVIPAGDLLLYFAIVLMLMFVCLPDQVTRVPGYHHRLRAMLFKANFAEKVEEVKLASLKFSRLDFIYIYTEIFKVV